LPGWFKLTGPMVGFGLQESFGECCHGIEIPVRSSVWTNHKSGEADGQETAGPTITPDALSDQARIWRITCPATSVNRNRRPL
jgi:hypothetical protein